MKNISKKQIQAILQNLKKERTEEAHDLHSNTNDLLEDKISYRDFLKAAPRWMNGDEILMFNTGFIGGMTSVIKRLEQLVKEL